MGERAGRSVVRVVSDGPCFDRNVRPGVVYCESVSVDVTVGRTYASANFTASRLGAAIVTIVAVVLAVVR